nr:uncharacterized protein LOC127344597 isoform X2 [Lolium perenne]
MRRDATVAPQPVAAGAPEMRKAELLVIDVDAGAAAHGVACRICHLSPEGGDGPATVPGAQVIRLGCGCKEELGDAHRQCAEAWFRIKGDSLLLPDVLDCGNFFMRQWAAFLTQTC